MQDVYHRARSIRLAIFDVDGVLTDGTLYYSDSGAEIKAFNVRDGHGMKMLQASGVQIAIITSRRSHAVELRARDLGIDLVYQGASDKLATYRELLGKVKREACAAAYIGDDLVDLPVLVQSGLAVTVPEAPAAVRRCAHYVTQARGGHGAARELCELIMHAQGTLDTPPYRTDDRRENRPGPA
ncbi:MAG TPA: HAD-IIIA family hydrolase [Burkholderiales bacterium]|nr:HAD-IIIA family hydrolase [Burkholderiales bacterium]